MCEAACSPVGVDYRVDQTKNREKSKGAAVDLGLGESIITTQARYLAMR